MVVLMADDDEDDRQFASEAMRATCQHSDMRSVGDGRQLLDYLRREGDYRNRAGMAPMPDVILLDLNMPKMTGIEALAEIKSDTTLRSLPVVIFSDSGTTDDVIACYQLGANSYIRKPTGFDEWVDVMTGFRDYWFEVADLPRRYQQ